MATKPKTKDRGGGQQKTETTRLLEFSLRRVDIHIVGESELIMHKWSAKAKQMMLDKQMGKPTEKKPKKDPKRDYEESIYRDEKKNIAMPSAAFKAAIVSGCRMMEGLTMTAVKQCIRVDGQWTRIYGTHYMREDMVRLESGVADIRYRAGFPKWKAKLTVTWAANMISVDQLHSLVNAGGFAGVGEWRPSAPKSTTGSFGCFKVVSEQEYKRHG